MCLWIVRVAVYLFDAHLGKGTVHRTATMVAPLLLTSGPAKYEAVLHSCGGEGYPLVTWRLYSAASLGHQATGMMSCYPPQSQYPYTEPTYTNAERQARNQ